jgi:transposase
LCGAHLLRELTFFSELSSEQKEWAGPLKQLLLEIKARVEQVRENGSRDLNGREQEAFIERYERLVKQGLEGNRPLASSALLEEERGSRAAICQRQAHNLLLRMEWKKEQVLRFMRDFTVGFDNNQAERDLRMVKLQQKVSGCFRSEEGARRFCRIRSYISTIRKQGQGVLQALDKACRGAPLSPTRCAR